MFPRGSFFLFCLCIVAVTSRISIVKSRNKQCIGHGYAGSCEIVPDGNEILTCESLLCGIQKGPIYYGKEDQRLVDGTRCGSDFNMMCHSGLCINRAHDLKEEIKRLMKEDKKYKGLTYAKAAVKIEEQYVEAEWSIPCRTRS